MDTYLIECDVCDAECHIVSREEPEFCPFCGDTMLDQYF